MGFAEVTLQGISLKVKASITLIGMLLLSGAVRAADCGSGVDLRLSSPATAQGTLLLAEIRSAKPLGEVSGRWSDRDVPFWQEHGKKAAAASGDAWNALLGVDLEKAPGEYEFTVAGKLPGGEAVSCRAMVKVTEGHF